MAQPFELPLGPLEAGWLESPATITMETPGEGACSESIRQLGGEGIVQRPPLFKVLQPRFAMGGFAALLLLAMVGLATFEHRSLHAVESMEVAHGQFALRRLDEAEKGGTGSEAKGKEAPTTAATTSEAEGKEDTTTAATTSEAEDKEGTTAAATTSEAEDKEGTTTAATTSEAEGKEGTTAAEAEDRNNTGFQNPAWEPRCPVNRSSFEPSCLPEQVYETNDVALFMFAQLCGVQAANIRVSNILSKEDVHAKIYQLMYENLVMTITHSATGLLIMGIFLKHKKDLKKQEEGKPTGLKAVTACASDFIFFGSTAFSALSAMCAGIFTFLKFWRETHEFLSGVYYLPSEVASFHCKSVLATEVLYYKDILGYITLSAFNMVDMITVLSMFCVWCCASFNLTFNALIVGPIRICCTFCFEKFLYCLTCKWCSVLWSWIVWYLHFIFCCGWVTYCQHGCMIFCEMLKLSFVKICVNLKWFFTGGCCELVMRIPMVCSNCCKYECWHICFCFKHLSCVCCANYCCHDCCVIFSYVLASGLIFVFMIICAFVLAYLFLGLVVFFVVVGITVGVILFILMFFFWVLTQIVTVFSMIKDMATGEKDNPAEFMSPTAYYEEYFSQIADQVGDVFGSFNLTDKFKKTEEAHPQLPSIASDATVVAKEATKDNRLCGIGVPTAIVGMLVIGSGLTRLAQTSLLLQARSNLSWMGCAGGAMDCEQADHKAYTEAGPEGIKLVEVAGVPVPHDWPILTGCECFSCNDNSLITDNVSCGALNLPGSTHEPLSCASGKDYQAQTEQSRRLFEVFDASAIKQNASNVSTPTGTGEGGVVLEGRHVYLGNGMKLHPKVLNSFKMPAQRPPAKGCYGAQIPSLALLQGLRMDGWCDCGSQEFVPSSYDILHRVPVVPFPPYISQYLPPAMITDVGIGSWQRVEGELFITAQQPDAPVWDAEWLEDRERDTMEWAAEFGGDRQIGFRKGPFVNTWNACTAFADSVSRVFNDLFVDCLYYYFKLVTTKFDECVEWAKHEFYTIQRFRKVFTSWMHSGDEEAFRECHETVLLGRSMASLMMGLATALTYANLASKGDYQLIA